MKTTASSHAVRRIRKLDLWDILIRLFLIAASLACLLPFVHVVAKSLSEDAYVIANKVFLWPAGFTLDAYGKVFADQSILRSLYISVIITVLFTVIGMIVTICAAYPLSRKQLKGRSFFTFIFMFTMFFGGGIIPEYMLINSLGMLDSIWSLILPLSFSAFNLLILRTSISSNIPASLEESARMDGAGHFRILFSIVLPLSKPILATLSLFYAVGRWNAYQDALFYIKHNVDLRPLQLKLYYLVVQASESFQLEMTQVSLSNPEVLKAACVVFATLPIICVYPFIQKYFVKGVMLGAIKE
ncbi:carbohydrate ABC transporter permease [Paenibacillus lactis]|uniref:Binding-protein-dependent transport systems inner membrane component n=2 Tax=Paenibacillus lactis TaxID=228574 RepID=G4HA46_9BACL|nr:carbohydrate ABC transporter permease [Paenibacillus lactis]EHB66805.1 binding-protein-dependent transport systems inner membrane component [Paenibacillus lactis 154]MBP1893691.1 putative aldouronate transport system permease protein [Paenibacillus lactis]GIO92452.1 putative ABC transporter permease protein YtcP [Paenibacillus lactis]